MGLSLEIRVYEVMDLLRPEVLKGNILPVTEEEVRESLFDGFGLLADMHGETSAYLRVLDYPECRKVSSLVVSDLARGEGLADYLLDQAKEKFVDKPLIAVANGYSLKHFLRHGFEIGDKLALPVIHRGGRTEAEWLAAAVQFIYYGRNPFE